MTVHDRIVAEPFSLQRRNPAGGTKPLTAWGFANETDVLTDVLLGSPNFLRHLSTSSLSQASARSALQCPDRAGAAQGPGRRL